MGRRGDERDRRVSRRINRRLKGAGSPAKLKLRPEGFERYSDTSPQMKPYVNKLPFLSLRAHKSGERTSLDAARRDRRSRFLFPTFEPGNKRVLPSPALYFFLYIWLFIVRSELGGSEQHSITFSISHPLRRINIPFAARACNRVRLPARNFISAENGPSKVTKIYIRPGSPVDMHGPDDSTPGGRDSELRPAGQLKTHRGNARNLYLSPATNSSMTGTLVKYPRCSGYFYFPRRKNAAVYCFTSVGLLSPSAARVYTENTL